MSLFEDHMPTCCQPSTPFMNRIHQIERKLLTIVQYKVPVVFVQVVIASTGYCTGDFSENAPTEEQLSSLIQVVFENHVERFCFEGYKEPNLFENAEAIFRSFGESAQITVQSVKILQVGKYKEYWPIRVNASGTCVLKYRSDFAQHAPAFSKWRGRTIKRDIDTTIGVDVREDDFGKLQIRLKEYILTRDARNAVGQ